MDGILIEYNFSGDEAHWEDVIREFTGHTSSIYSVAFSPDGRQILTGSWDNTARLWRNFKEYMNSGKVEQLTVRQKKEFGIK